MFSTMYRVTQKDFYARPYTSMWAPVVARQISRRYSSSCHVFISRTFRVLTSSQPPGNWANIIRQICNGSREIYNLGLVSVIQEQSGRPIIYFGRQKRNKIINFSRKVSNIWTTFYVKRVKITNNILPFVGNFGPLHFKHSKTPLIWTLAKQIGLALWKNIFLL
jgi:hypothetical protein